MMVSGVRLGVGGGLLRGGGGGVLEVGELVWMGFAEAKRVLEIALDTRGVPRAAPDTPPPRRHGGLREERVRVLGVRVVLGVPLGVGGEARVLVREGGGVAGVRRGGA